MNTEQPPQLHLVTGNDAMNKLLDIYLNGFVSGAASGVASVLSRDNDPTPAIDQFAEQISEMLVSAIRADPITIEALRQEIAETLTGTDSGPKSFTLPVPDAEDDR